MDLSLNQVVYALTFICVLFAVEGVYLLIMSQSSRERAVNRRMKLVQKNEARALDPSIMKREVYGDGVSRFLLGAVPSLGEILWTANIRLTPTGFLAVCAGVFALAFAFGGLILSLPSLYTLLFALVIGVGAPYLYVLSARNKRQKAFAEQLPTTIDLVTRGLQAGHPVPVALAMVASEMPDPIGSEFGVAMDEINYGLDRDAAMRAITRRFPNPDFRFFVAALEMQRETGGNLVEVLEKLSEVIRARANMRKKVEAISAEGRLTAFVVGGLPFAIAVVINVINPGYYAAVFSHPLFLIQMGAAFSLWAIGIFMIWKMVNFKI